MNEIITRALVTGGSGGIGASICRALGAQGHFVYVHAHRGVAAAEATAAGIVSAGGHAT
jgi:3-oxoacyl-[acyl-carrier protein] reductase